MIIYLFILKLLYYVEDDDEKAHQHLKKAYAM